MSSPVAVPSVVKTPKIVTSISEAKPDMEDPRPKLEIEQKPDEPEIPETTEPEIPAVEDIVQDEMETELEPVSEIQLEEPVPEVSIKEPVKTVQDEVKKVQKTTVLKPITKLDAVDVVATTVLKPVSSKVLTPVKRRGAPPSSAPGVKPGSKTEIKKITTLKPLTKLNPVNTKDLDSANEDK